MLEIQALFPLSLSAYHPKMCGFLSVWTFLLFFVLGPRCLQDAWFPAIWPYALLSLLIPRYLPAVTPASCQSFQGVTGCRGGKESLDDPAHCLYKQKRELSGIDEGLQKCSFLCSKDLREIGK